MARKTFIGQAQRTKEIMEIIHTNVYGPFKENVRGGFVYFIFFIDDLSRYITYIY